MFPAIIILLENTGGPQPPVPKPRVYIDRGGGGGAGYPAFQIADFMRAAASFAECPGEDSVARAVRRAEHIHRELAHQDELRRTQAVAMSQGLLLGAELQRRVQADAADAAAEATWWNSPAQPVPAPTVASQPRVRGRGEYRGGNGVGNGAALLVGGILGGILIGAALARR